MISSDDLDRQREQCRGMSDQELINVIHGNLRDLKLQIAAKQVQEERRGASEKAMHAETQKKLSELKVPHCTVWPNFIFTMISAMAAVAAAYFAWRSLHPAAPKPPAVIQTLKALQLSPPQKAPVPQKP